MPRSSGNGKHVAGWMLVAAAGVLTLAMSCGRLSWLLELLSHFRLQAAVLCLLPALLFAVVRRWAAAAIMLALCVWHGSFVIGVYLPREHETRAGDVSVRLMVANVMTANRNREQLLELVRRETPDLLLVMEIDERWSAALQSLESYPYRIEQPRQDNFGIALYSRLPLRAAGCEFWGDARLPTIVAEVEAGGGRLHFVGTHPVPPVSARHAQLRNQQLEHVALQTARQQLPVILAGDLNTSPWSPCFRDLCQRGRLRDSRQGFGLQTTWPARWPLLSIPIDHILVSPAVAVVDRRVGPDLGSDHRPVIADLAIAGR